MQACLSGFAGTALNARCAAGAADPYRACPRRALGAPAPPDTQIATVCDSTVPIAGCGGPGRQAQGLVPLGGRPSRSRACPHSLPAGFDECAELPECKRAGEPHPAACRRCRRRPSVNARCPSLDPRRRPAQQRQPRRGAAPVRAAYAQIGHTDRTHESMNGPGSAYRPGTPSKKLPIAYSPEWIALREHTKEIEKLWVLGWVLLRAAGCCWVLAGVCCC